MVSEELLEDSQQACEQLLRRQLDELVCSLKKEDHLQEILDRICVCFR